MRNIELDLLESTPYVRHVAFVDETSGTYHVPRRILYDFEIIFVTHGELKVVLDNAEYILKQSDFHIMKPFVPHRRLIEEGKICKYYNIHFDFSKPSKENDFNADDIYIKECHKNLDESEINTKLSQRNIYMVRNIVLPDIFKIGDPLRMTNCMKKIDALFERDTDYCKFQLKGMFIYMLGILLEEMEYSSGLKEKDVSLAISRLKSYILECFDLAIDFEELSASYGYSPSYLRKAFKKAEGSTPSRFLTDIRLENAKIFLSGKEYSVGEVAKMVGYNDIYYFSKVFKEREGMPPLKYRADAASRYRREKNGQS